MDTGHRPFRFVLCEGTYITQGIQRRSKFHSLGAKKVVMFIKTRTCFLLMVKRSQTESPESHANTTSCSQRKPTCNGLLALNVKVLTLCVWVQLCR